MVSVLSSAVIVVVGFCSARVVVGRCLGVLLWAMWSTGTAERRSQSICNLVVAAL